MFERTRRGLTIAKSSLVVLGHHPKLLTLPILSTTAFVGVATLSFAPMYASQQTGDSLVLILAGWTTFILATTFVTVFFNSALVSCVLDAFSGREVSLRAGLSASRARLSPIFRWTLYSSVVGLLVNFVQSLLRKFGILGAFAGSAAELSWDIATYFVVPVLVAEGVGPEEALKRSAEIVKRNWGTAVGTEAGVGVLALLLAFGPPIFLIGYINSKNMVSGTPNHGLVVSGIAIGVYLVILLSTFSALGTIFRTGVYFFAQTGRTPLEMDPSLYASAMRKNT